MYDETTLILNLVALVVGTIVSCVISSRLGYSPALGCLNLLPCIGGFVLLAIWMFFESPNEKRLRSLERQRSRTPNETPLDFSGVQAQSPEPHFGNASTEEPITAELKEPSEPMLENAVHPDAETETGEQSRVGNTAAALSELKQLFEAELISPVEFDSKKAEILSRL